jgi:CsoR family transcriptional regulator, copper-sensing transcriptional repressor
MGEFLEQAGLAEASQEDAGCADILLRLRRLEGQVRGLQRMIQERRDCGDTLTQLLAVRSGLDEVGARIVDTEIARCLPDQGPRSQQLSAALRLWLRLR